MDLTATISATVDHRDAIQRIKQRLLTIPNVLTSPAPEVEILQFTPAGPLLCVRPYCSNEHYGQVVFDTSPVIRETSDEAGYPSPMPAYAVSGMFAGPPPDFPGR